MLKYFACMILGEYFVIMHINLIIRFPYCRIYLIPWEITETIGKINCFEIVLNYSTLITDVVILVMLVSKTHSHSKILNYRSIIQIFFVNVPFGSLSFTKWAIFLKFFFVLEPIVNYFIFSISYCKCRLYMQYQIYADYLN